MSEPLVRIDRDGHVATLTFHNPERRNAMTQAMGEAFAGTLAGLAEDSSLRALVLPGAPEGRAFSAGGDLGMLVGRADEAGEGARDEVRDSMRSFYALFLGVRELHCPTIAALNGAAIGAGLCVALACDLRVAARGAKLALNFSRLGIHPGMGATWTLPRLVGPSVAADLLYTGRTVTGEEAATLGLVNRCVEAEAVVDEARRIANEIAAQAPRAVRGIKRALSRSATAALADQLDLEAEEQADCFQTEDLREGLAAMRERRVPRFRDR